MLYPNGCCRIGGFLLGGSCRCLRGRWIGYCLGHRVMILEKLFHRLNIRKVFFSCTRNIIAFASPFIDIVEKNIS